jgi:hypothetical protein
MSELENRITKITIPNENTAFFTGKNFTWDSIPILLGIAFQNLPSSLV